MMKKYLLASVFALSLPLAAMAQTAASTADNSESSAGAATPVTLSAQDQSFATTAATAGLSEVQEGKLAASKGDKSVKEVGNRMVTDHTKANDTLSSLAAAKGLTLPDSLTSVQAAQLAHLQDLKGTAFDSAYLKDQRQAHEKAIKLFETEAASGTDADLKTFAQNTLPMLKMHLQMIEAAK